MVFRGSNKRQQVESSLENDVSKYSFSPFPSVLFSLLYDAIVAASFASPLAQTQRSLLFLLLFLGRRSTLVITKRHLPFTGPIRINVSRRNVHVVVLGWRWQTAATGMVLQVTEVPLEQVAFLVILLHHGGKGNTQIVQTTASFGLLLFWRRSFLVVAGVVVVINIIVVDISFLCSVAASTLGSGVTVIIVVVVVVGHIVLIGNTLGTVRLLIVATVGTYRHGRRVRNITGSGR